MNFNWKMQKNRVKTQGSHTLKMALSLLEQNSYKTFMSYHNLIMDLRRKVNYDPLYYVSDTFNDFSQLLKLFESLPLVIKYFVLDYLPTGTHHSDYCYIKYYQLLFKLGDFRIDDEDLDTIIHIGYELGTYSHPLQIIADTNILFNIEGPLLDYDGVRTNLLDIKNRQEDDAYFSYLDMLDLRCQADEETSESIKECDVECFDPSKCIPFTAKMSCVSTEKTSTRRDHEDTGGVFRLYESNPDSLSEVRLHKFDRVKYLLDYLSTPFFSNKNTKSSDLTDLANLPATTIYKVGSYLVRLVRSSTMTDVLHIFADLLVDLYGLSLDMFRQVQSSIHKVITNFTGIEVQSEAGGRRMLNFLHSLRDGTVSFLDTSLYHSLRKLLSMFTTCSLAKAMGLSDRLKCVIPLDSAVNCEKMSLLEVGAYLSDSMLEFLEGSYQYFIEGSNLQFIHSNKSYAKWAADVEYLTSNEHLTSYEPDCEKPFVYYEVYNEKIVAAYLHGKEILKQIGKIPSLKKDSIIVSNYCGRVSRLYGKYVLRESYGTNRKTPLGVLIVGRPQTGKSKLSKEVYKLYHTISQSTIPFSDDLIYTRNGTSKFMDGYSSQPYVTLDDIGKFDNIDQHCEEFTDIIEMINVVPFMPNMAAVEDKGMIAFRAKAVIATSNLPYGGMEKIFACPDAALRRFPFRLRVEVKDEFSVLDESGRFTGMIDAVKVKESGVDPSHVYKLYLDRLVLSQKALGAKGMGCAYEQITVLDPDDHPTSEFDDVFQALGKEMKYFYEGQQFSSKIMKAEYLDDFCGSCYRKCCVCAVEAQSTEEIITTVCVGMGIFIIYQRVIQPILVSVYAIVETIRNMERYLTSPENVRRVLDNVAIEVQKDILGVKSYLLDVFKTGALVLSGIGVASFLYNNRLISQGNLPFKERKSNAWKTTEPVIFKEQLSITSKTANFFDVTSKIRKSMIYCKVSRPDPSDDNSVLSRTVVGLPVGGRDYLFTNHSLPSEGTFKMAIWKCHGNGIVPKKEIIVSQQYISRTDEKSDLALVRIPQYPPGPNFLRFMPEDTPDIQAFTSGALLVSDAKAKRTDVVSIPAVTTRISPIIHNGKVLGDKDKMYLTYAYQAKGMCGSPYVGNVSGHPSLAGIHVAGDERNNRGFAFPLSQSLITGLRSHLDVLFTEGLEPQGFDLTSYKKPVELVNAVHPKSLAYYCEGTGMVFGEVKGAFSGKPKHSVEKSLMYDAVAETFGDSGYRPPDMKIGNTIHGYKNPYQEATQKIVSAKTLVNPYHIDLAVESLLDKIYSNVDMSALKELRPLSDIESINGIPGVMYIDGINRGKGGGFGMFAKKSDYLEPYISELYPDGVTWDEVVMRHIRTLESKMLNGPVGPIFYAHIKDEPVKLKPGGDREDPDYETHRWCDYDCENFHKKLPRVFTGTPAAWTHVVRKLYLPIVRLIQSYNLAFECAVGINAESGDWSTVFDYLTKFGTTRIVAGDYGSYDKRMDCLFVQAGNYILMDIARKSEHYLRHHLKMMEGVGIDSAFPLVYIYYLLVRFFNSLPSGHPLTTILNSLANSLMLRVAWIMLGYPIGEFNDNVTPFVYGDDNIMGVSGKYDFSHTKISKVMSQMGFEYTMPDKRSDSMDFVSIFETEFLKRSFRKGVLGIMAPLAETSIIRMMSYVYATKEPLLPHMLTIQRTVLRYVFQAGKHEFERYKSFIERFNEGKYENVLPTYEEIFSTLKDEYESTHVRALKVQGDDELVELLPPLQEPKLRENEWPYYHIFFSFTNLFNLFRAVFRHCQIPVPSFVNYVASIYDHQVGIYEGLDKLISDYVLMRLVLYSIPLALFFSFIIELLFLAIVFYSLYMPSVFFLCWILGWKAKKHIRVLYKKYTYLCPPYLILLFTIVTVYLHHNIIPEEN